MTKLTTLLGATTLALSLLTSPAHAAEQPNIVQALMKCDATYFQALAQEKRIPEALKVQNKDQAYFKIAHHPLDVIKFDKPLSIDGLTVTGAVFNDSVLRYFGMPEMHSYFWGLLVKDDFETTLTKLKQNWDVLDINHQRAALPLVNRKVGAPVWESFKRPADRRVPDMGVAEKGFNVMPYGKEMMLFCALQSAGAPDEGILSTTRPDLLFGDKEITIVEPLDDHNRPHVDTDGKNLRTGKANVPDDMKNPAQATKTPSAK